MIFYITFRPQLFKFCIHMTIKKDIIAAAQITLENHRIFRVFLNNKPSDMSLSAKDYSH